ncbi:MAG: hypothetical protein AUJ12_04140 [Alphaproteobacteria bacterium CG1_02_46_17]|nr:MAG: hypothetical protein AUJ12_04140 [Alphaproteobacteria bacterium CG1_02_46_17]
MKKHTHLFRVVLLSILGLAIGFGIALYSKKEGSLPPSQDQSSSHILAATSIGGPFSLVDQDGQPRTEKDYADKFKLMYFGFTYCPAICPTELSKMSEAYLSLPEEMQQKLQPIFITIDPERDTPTVIKGYVNLFMPQLVGLTGSVDQIESVKKSFKVYAAKVSEGDGSDPEDYTMDHSSMIYLLDPAGQTVGLFKTADTSEDIKARLMDVLAPKN